MARLIRVTKRDGRRERFSSAKLARAVEKAAREGKIVASKRKRLSREVARDVAASLGRRSAVRSTELRARTLRRLDNRARRASTAWRRYERRRR